MSKRGAQCAPPPSRWPRFLSGRAATSVAPRIRNVSLKAMIVAGPRNRRSSATAGMNPGAAETQAEMQGGVPDRPETPPRNAALISASRLLRRRDQATSKRSWFITLVHAATKSFRNFSVESAQA